MKNILVLILLVSNLSFAAVSEGTDQGNGGDAVAIEFRSLGLNVVKQLKINKTNSAKLVDLRKLEVVINSVGVDSTKKELFLYKVRKDAINYPTQNKIIINVKRWEAMNFESKRMLILHESLGIMRVDDSKYNLSTKLEKLTRSKLRVCTFSKTVDEEVTEIGKITLDGNSSEIVLENDSVSALIIQKYGRATLSIYDENFEVKGDATMDGGRMAISHKNADGAYHLECIR